MKQTNRMNQTFTMHIELTFIPNFSCRVEIERVFPVYIMFIGVAKSAGDRVHLANARTINQILTIMTIQYVV